MSLKVAIPLKSVGDPSDLSSPHNRYSNRLFFFSFEPPNPVQQGMSFSDDECPL